MQNKFIHTTINRDNREDITLIFSWQASFLPEIFCSSGCTQLCSRLDKIVMLQKSYDAAKQTIISSPYCAILGASEFVCDLGNLFVRSSAEEYLRESKQHSIRTLLILINYETLQHGINRISFAQNIVISKSKWSKIIAEVTLTPKIAN